MRRRNLIVTSDSDSDNADEVATASVASGGGGSQCRPTKPTPFPLPSSPPPSLQLRSPTTTNPKTPTATPPSSTSPTTSPPAPASGPGPAPPPANPPSVLGDRLRPVDELLRGLGLRLRPEWLESCAAGIPVFDGLDAAGQARRCFEQLLFADMNVCGAGALPEGVSSMHSAVLDGPFVLQVDEIVNISAPLKERYHDAHAGPKRCLKLSMTDGIQHVFGIEYRPIKALEILAPAGFKIIIRNVHVRRGLLMLVPEVIELLGGVVDELEAARDRLVSEVNKPPRGKRKQGGLPLSRRATLAAWQSNTNLTDGGQQGTSTPGIVNPSHPTGLGNASQVGTTARTVIEHADPPVAVNNVQERSRCVQEITMQDLTPAVARNNREVSASVSRRFDSQCGIGGPSANDSAARSSNVDETIDPMEYLSGQNEKPFTYLFCMMADWGTQQDAKPYIQGKIKGSFTGVKGFQYKQRRQYELHVYIDDGSLISEASVDHDVVQNKIGHSPEEVAAALASTDTETVSEMREILKRFQRFLSKYEGTMLIELNRSSSLPIVREMNEGCSSSDAWDLFRRLKTFYARRHLHSQLDFMDTTP